jgi:hypothetical protein
MKRISLIVLICFAATIIPGHGQQKITRYIHQKDYLDYGTQMFSKTTKDIYLLAISGKIKGYRDSALQSSYDLNQIIRRGERCEKVKKQDASKANNDTTVCLPLDFEATPIWLKIREANEQIHGFTKLPLALYCDSFGKPELLFYVNFQDLTKIDSSDQFFLSGYLNIVTGIPENGWILINQGRIRQYASERFSTVTNMIKNITPNEFTKIYDSDSLNTEYTAESYHKKKEILSGLSQNFEVDSTLGIIVAEELRWTEDGFKIKDSAIGIGGDVQAGGSSLSDMPFFYVSYKDARLKFLLSDNSNIGSSFGFLMKVSEYQIFRSITDMSWH